MDWGKFTEIVLSIVLGGLAGFVAAAIKLGRYAQIVDDLKSKSRSLEGDIKQLSTKLTECFTKLEERTSKGSEAYTKRKSPISLNEKGEELLKISLSDKFVLDNKDELVEKIRALGHKTAYDVQVYARQVVESLYNEDRFSPFKNYVFKEGLDIDIIYTVMSIYLRDVALPSLGFTYDQIDQTDPSKIKA